MWTVQTGTVQSFSSSHRESLVWTGLYISVPCFCVLVVFDFWKESASVLPVQRHFNSKCKDSSPVDSNRSCSGRIYCSIRLANVRIKSWFLLGSLILGGSVLTASCWRCLILDLTTRLFLCVAARCFFHVVIQRFHVGKKLWELLFPPVCVLYVELNCLFLTLTVDFLWWALGGFRWVEIPLRVWTFHIFVLSYLG